MKTSASTRLLLAFLAGGALLSLPRGVLAAPVEIKEEAKEKAPGVELDMVGRPVPPFTLLDRDGKGHSPEEAKGKVLLIQLWGVNCGSCLEEMAYFDSSLYPALKEKGFLLWGVNADQRPWSELTHEMERVKAKAAYPLLADPDGAVTALFTTWFIPVTVIVDTRGVVQYYKVGFSQADQHEVRKKIESLLP